ncbi:MAG: hypothetical protein WBM64_03735, partial [Woeseiaceae bacterium]
PHQSGGSTMTTAVVATYKDAGTIRNVKDDLISTGIPNDAIKIDKEHIKIRVMVPDQTKAEIMEILNRHAPAAIH